MTPHLVGGALNKCEVFNYARKREGVEKCGTKTNWSVWQRNYLGKAGWEILWEHSEELIGVNRLPRYSSSLPLPTVRTANSSTQDQTNFLLLFSDVSYNLLIQIQHVTLLFLNTCTVKRILLSDKRLGLKKLGETWSQVLKFKEAGHKSQFLRSPC